MVLYGLKALDFAGSGYVVDETHDTAGQHSGKNMVGAQTGEAQGGILAHGLQQRGRLMIGAVRDSKQGRCGSQTRGNGAEIVPAGGAAAPVGARVLAYPIRDTAVAVVAQGVLALAEQAIGRLGYISGDAAGGCRG